jgi:hypothetical protein
MSYPPKQTNESTTIPALPQAAGSASGEPSAPEPKLIKYSEITADERAQLRELLEWFRDSKSFIWPKGKTETQNAAGEPQPRKPRT